MSAKNKYRIPVPQHLLDRIDRTSPAHVGKLRNTVYFIVPPDTPVLAEMSEIALIIWVNCGHMKTAVWDIVLVQLLLFVKSSTKRTMVICTKNCS
jgi:hypothetical protein